MNRALSIDEEIEAAQLLSDSGPRTLVFARGVFTATAISPKPMDPTQWLPLVVGGQLPDTKTLKRLLSLLIRDAANIAGQLAAGQPATPVSEDNDIVREFCRGFVQVAQKEPAWTANQAAFDLTLPLLVLSQYVEPASLNTVKPEAAQHPEQYASACVQQLPETVLALYDFFRNARVKSAEAQEALEKVGRNDPCPCGSGKKFKKCCGL